MTDSALEKIRQLAKDMDTSVAKSQAERDRLRERSHASLQRLHRIVRELKEAEPDDTA